MPLLVILVSLSISRALLHPHTRSNSPPGRHEVEVSTTSKSSPSEKTIVAPVVGRLSSLDVAIFFRFIIARTMSVTDIIRLSIYKMAEPIKR